MTDKKHSQEITHKYKMNYTESQKKFGDLTIDEKVSLAENVYATNDHS